MYIKIFLYFLFNFFIAGVCIGFPLGFMAAMGLKIPPHFNFLGGLLPLIYAVWRTRKMINSGDFQTEITQEKKRENISGTKFKNREDYLKWKELKLNENERKKQKSDKMKSFFEVFQKTNELLMKNKQKSLLIGIAVIITLMLLFPPFHTEYQKVIINEGYGFLFSPPDGRATVDIGMLLLQWFGVSIVGVIILYILKDK